MSDLFVDTSGWANFFISTENYSTTAVECVREAQRTRQRLIKTNYVIAELVALLGSRYQLPQSRPDKAWSLVDASSFVVMKQLGIQTALTTDRHFEQAGFIRLLKSMIRSHYSPRCLSTYHLVSGYCHL